MPAEPVPRVPQHSPDEMPDEGTDNRDITPRPPSPASERVGRRVVRSCLYDEDPRRQASHDRPFAGSGSLLHLPRCDSEPETLAGAWTSRVRSRGARSESRQPERCDCPGRTRRYSGGELQADGPRFDRHSSIGESDGVVGPVASDRLKRLACEMWRAAASAMAQRLWLTTSTLCTSGSRTNAA
jgi:hypothetical protein